MFRIDPRCGASAARNVHHDLKAESGFPLTRWPENFRNAAARQPADGRAKPSP
jgi:hypothetical protein